MRFFRYIYLILFLFLKSPILCSGQEDPYKIDKYKFLKMDADHLVYFGASEKSFDLLFEKYNRLITQGQGQLNIVHIGDSHIQADFFPNEVRTKLLALNPWLEAGRGFVFPYKVAKTNNPDNYKVEYTGNWERCRNVESDRKCELGVAGIVVSTTDSVATITFKINPNGATSFSFSKVRVFYNMETAPYSIIADEFNPQPVRYYDLNKNLMEFHFTKYYDQITFRFIKTDTTKTPLEIYGFDLATDDAGLVYTSLGVNGATAASFNRCRLFESQLRQLSPDLVIVSLGTNEASGKTVDKTLLYSNFDSLVKKIRISAPDAAILLTGPGDFYKSKRYPNYNVVDVKNTLEKLSATENLAYWDWFTIMGGINSINSWYHYGLAGKDKIHLSPKGYTLQGDLLYYALLKAWDQYLDKKMEVHKN